MVQKLRFRNCCVTSYDLSKFEEWQNLPINEVQYFVYQKEKCPKTDKIHIQGYLELAKEKMLGGVKRLLGDNTLHVEKRRGTQHQAIEYCKKEGKEGGRVEDTDVIELGQPRKQGQRTDLLAVAKMIKEGASELEILDGRAREYLKYSGHIKRAIDLRRRATLNQYSPIDVTVLWGDSRSGKTSTVLKKHGAENVYIPHWNGNKWWFDGYEGQKVLLINEFYGQCRTTVMQELLDDYRKQVEYKGGFTTSAWDHVYITSNVHPSQWWNSFENVPYAVEESFIERINHIVHMKRKIDRPRLTWEERDCSLEDLDKTGEVSITLATSADQSPKKKISPKKKLSPKRIFSSGSCKNSPGSKKRKRRHRQIRPDFKNSIIGTFETSNSQPVRPKANGVITRMNPWAQSTKTRDS